MYFTAIILISFNLLSVSKGQNFFSNAKPHPKCLGTEPTNDLDMEFAMSMFGGKHFYITMGSVRGFESLHHLLTGSKLENPADLEAMCAQVYIKAFKSTTEAYDDKILVIDCAMIKKGLQDCKANPRTQHPKRHAAVAGVLSLAWTDNKNGIILVHCSPDGKNNHWLLYSTNTTLATGYKETVGEAVAKMGFEKDKIYSPSFNKCKIIPVDD